MKEWIYITAEKIKEYFLVTYLVSYLIYAAAIFMLFDRIKKFDAILLPLTFGGIITLVMLLYLILYKLKDQTISLEKATPYSYSFAFINILFISILTFFSDLDYLNIKTIFFIPVILCSLSYDKKYRKIITLGCVLALLATDYFKKPEFKVLQDIYDSNVLLLGIIFLVNWLIGSLRDIELQTQKHLENLANIDDLTGLANHRHFQEQLSFEIEKAEPTSNHLALILLDIDYFKFYNDTYGHQQGDEVLKQVGEILKAEVGELGLTSRYGGEEFAIILPGVAAEQAAVVAERLRAKVSANYFYGAEMQPQGKLTVSCGISIYPEHGDNKKDLIRNADEALYKAKNNARNKVELYFTVFNELGSSVRKNERDLINSVRTLVSIINAKDRYTYGHSERVALYAQELATKINLSEKQIKLLAYGAFLHDIGKIEISRDLLNKTTKPTADERQILNQHPIWGADIVKPIMAFREISPLILHHHENYDGTGYPLGLKGMDIPIEARVLRIVDSFDAMTTSRPYKPAMDTEAALQELLRCSGTHFDPYMVSNFVNLFREGKLGKYTA